MPRLACVRQGQELERLRDELEGGEPPPGRVAEGVGFREVPRHRHCLASEQMTHLLLSGIGAPLAQRVHEVCVTANPHPQIRRHGVGVSLGLGPARLETVSGGRTGCSRVTEHTFAGLHREVAKRR